MIPIFSEMTSHHFSLLLELDADKPHYGTLHVMIDGLPIVTRNFSGRLSTIREVIIAKAYPGLEPRVWPGPIPRGLSVREAYERSPEKPQIPIEAL